MDIRTESYDHPDARVLIAEVQAEYVVRYNDPAGDSSPVDPAEFVVPCGRFFVGYINEEPVATGAWRFGGPNDGDAEIKRMYVRPAYRGRGLSRCMLGHIEGTAASAGVNRLVLETGDAQPEAIGLYLACGYKRIEPFGFYAYSTDSLHLAKVLNLDVRQARGESSLVAENSSIG